MRIDLWKLSDVKPYAGYPRQNDAAIARELGKPIRFLRVNGQAEENPGHGRG